MRSHVAPIAILLGSLAGSLVLAACGSDDNGNTAVPDDTPQETKEPEKDIEEPATCDNVTGNFTATKENSNALFLIDRSGSMQYQLTDATKTRWSATKQGFFALLDQLPATSQAGSMVFPQGDKGITYCQGATKPASCVCQLKQAIRDMTCDDRVPGELPRCDSTKYTVNVANAALDATQVTKMKDLITADDKNFYWGTPLAPALSAAIAAQKASALTGVRSVILLTDGNPTSCDDNGGNAIQTVVDIAAAGLASDPPVRTFVMGVVDGKSGASPTNLSPIAKAGGTGRTATCETDNSCFYQINAATFQDDIKKAFDAIAAQAFDCTFKVEPGENNDPEKTNVTLTTAAGEKTVAKDTNHQDGWDYLSGGTSVQLYGQACTDLKSDPAAKVDIVIGCKTVTKKPK
jgi:hypothetical protein